MFLDEKLEQKVRTVAGLRTFFQTPEDLLLSKLLILIETFSLLILVKTRNGLSFVNHGSLLLMITGKLS